MEEMDRLRAVTARLRAPDGCPWDRAQTHESLKPECIEEAAEVICGIRILTETGDAENLKEELGDLLFQVLMQSQIAEEEGLFTLEDVIRGITEKMVRRHPHVFGEKGQEQAPALKNTEKSEEQAPVLQNGGHEEESRWERQKKAEKAGREWEKAYLPAAFDEAEELIKRARKRKGIGLKDQ